MKIDFRNAVSVVIAVVLAGVSFVTLGCDDDGRGASQTGTTNTQGQQSSSTEFDITRPSVAIDNVDDVRNGTTRTLRFQNHDASVVGYYVGEDWLGVYVSKEMHALTQGETFTYTLSPSNGLHDVYVKYRFRNGEFYFYTNTVAYNMPAYADETDEEEGDTSLYARADEGRRTHSRSGRRYRRIRPPLGTTEAEILASLQGLFMPIYLNMSVRQQAPYHLTMREKAKKVVVKKVITNVVETNGTQVVVVETNTTTNITVPVYVNPPPTITLTLPRDSTRVHLREAVEVVAEASDTNGTVAKVVFFTNNALWKEITNGPYRTTFRVNALGTYTLSATAVDDENAKAESEAVRVTFTNAKPKVTLTAPTGSPTLPRGSSVTFAADADDPDGAIVAVAFYTNGVFFQVDSNAPYAYTWDIAPAGTFSITAEALDDSGAKAYSKGESIAFQKDVYINTVGMVFNRVNGGTFSMGSEFGDENEKPVRDVTVGDYFISIHEVSYRAWTNVRAWATANGYVFERQGKMGSIDFGGTHTDLDPVVNIKWFDAVIWCNALGDKEGRTPCYYLNRARTVVYKAGEVPIAENTVRWSATGYRLPTEAEWEYACRAGSSSDYYWGSGFKGDYAWTYENSDMGAGAQTHEVGKTKPNAYGLYDVVGNVWEWVWDNYSEYYVTNDTENPKGPTSGVYRVMRSGSFNESGMDVRSSFRVRESPRYSAPDVGFRPVISVDGVKHATGGEDATNATAITKASIQALYGMLISIGLKR